MATQTKKRSRDAVSDAAAIADDLADIKEQLTRIKKRRGKNPLSHEQRLDVLYSYLSLRQEGLQERQRHPDRAAKAKNYRKRVHKLLGYGEDTVGRIYAEWNAARTVTVPQPAANRKPKPTCVPRTKAVHYIVRAFVREQRLHKRRVVAKTVLDELVKLGIIVLRDDGATAYSSALRAVQRYLVRHGFRRGRKKGAQTIEEEERLRDQRSLYLQTLQDNETAPVEKRMRVVDLDESYIHHHYKRHDDSIYDPNDPHYQQPREQHKGKRYCFVAAITAGNLRVEESKQQGADRPHLLRSSVYVFLSKNDDGKGDYHKNFNGTNFIDWFENTLMPSLEDLKPCLIRMDNAAYHFVLPPDAPKAYKMQKAQMQEKLRQLGVEFKETDTCPTLQAKLREYVDKNIKPQCIAIAEAHGHKVLPTVPYHSDLQPIELVWAQVKGGVGRQYSEGTTMQDVHTRLLKEFDNLVENSSRIKALYKHTARLENEFRASDAAYADMEADGATDEADAVDGSYHSSDDSDRSGESEHVEEAAQPPAAAISLRQRLAERLRLEADDVHELENSSVSESESEYNTDDSE